MTQIIYVDVLVVLNTVITFIMLLTTAMLTGVKNSSGRMVLGAVTGGLFSLILLAPSMSAVSVFLTKAAMAVSIVCISFKIHDMKRFFICIGLFLGVNLFYAGVMYGIDCLLAPTFISTRNGFSYYNIGTVGIIVLCSAVYYTSRLIKRYVLPDGRKPGVYDVTLFFGKNTTSARALLDTGNSVTDICGGDVIIVDVSVASALTGFSSEAFDGLNEENLGLLRDKGIFVRLLPVKLLDGTKMLPAFTADKAVVEAEAASGILKKPCIAVTAGSFDEVNYNALLAKNTIT